jgi:hypothetical protein
VLVIALVAAGSSWVLFDGVEHAPFHGDESGWISSGIYYSRLLSHGDFSREKWDCSDCKTWGALNAHLGKLLIGAPYFGCDAAKPCTFNGYYDFSMSFEDNQRSGRVPPMDVLRRARYASATAGVVCCLLVFAVGYTTGKPHLPQGLLCAALVLSTQIFHLAANQAMTDAFYNLFLLTQLFAATAIVKSGNESNMVRRLGVSGVLTGLTASVKPSGFVLGFPLFLVVAAYRLGVGGGYKRPENGRSFFFGAMTFSIVAIAVVYLLNPTFWPSGFSDLWRLMGFPEVLLAWDRYMVFQDATLGLGAWSGNRLLDMHRSIFIEYSNALVNLFFFVGLVVCTKRCLIAMRQGMTDASFVLIAYFFCNYALLVCALRLNWSRYYLPIELSMRVIAAIGMAALGTLAVHGAERIRGTRGRQSILPTSLLRLRAADCGRPESVSGNS